MLPTLIGLVVSLVGFFILLTRSMQAMMVFTMICTLLGGSAAIILISLGGSSIPPSMIGMGLLMLRGFQSEPGRKSQIGNAWRASLPYAIFAIYAVISAILMPRLFRHKISVVPLKPVGLRELLDVFPLESSSQNITSAVYIVGSVLLCVFAYVAVGRRMGAVYFVRAAIAIVFIHAMTGIMNVALPATIWSAISSVLRNGSYAALDQSIGQVIRISGIMPEPSVYAGYGFCWFVLVTELWLRDVMPKATGAAALLMGLVLTASTSSTAYVTLGAYLVVLIGRFLVFPKFFRFDKAFALVIFALLLAAIIAFVMILKPTIATATLSILKGMTVDKANSTSGQQRAFWAKQGLSAFTASYGLGIGAGSFRSSSLITAIIGSLGVVGSTAFVLQLGSVFRPLVGSTYTQIDDKVEAVGVAAAWAALFAVLAAALGAPSPDPGPIFSIFAGVALALRSRGRQSTGATSSAVRTVTREAVTVT